MHEQPRNYRGQNALIGIVEDVGNRQQTDAGTVETRAIAFGGNGGHGNPSSHAAKNVRA